MSCYGCGMSFSLFKKEHGCKNCGFAFCNSCLNKKIEVPKLKNEKHHVCNKCYNILTGKIKPQDESGRYSPPEAYKKRIEALEEREKAGGSSSHKMSHHNTKPGGKKEYKHLAKPEREIQERLDKLKEDIKHKQEYKNLTEKDIEQRLAKLKGQDSSSSSAAKKPVYQAPDRRTQQEQMNDLLDEIGQEIEIDSHRPDPVKDIEQRLAGLKGNPESEKPSNDLNRENLQEKVSFEKNININNKPNGQKDDTRTNDEIPLEEMQRLIAEASKDLELDAQKALEDLQKDKEIMKRLQEVKNRKKDDVNKDSDEKSVNDISDSDNEDEETLTKNLIKQMLEENKLDEAASRDGIGVSSSSQDSSKKSTKIQNTGANKGGKKSKKAKTKDVENEQQEISQSEMDDDDDELPYCVMCTEDATIRCHGCDLDLYCDRCWKEAHEQFEMEDHLTSKYLQRKRKS